MSRPRLLDLYSCAGGAAKGYHDAGFDVVGIDITPQPRYPYPFLMADALQALRILIRGDALAFSDGRQRTLADFDAIHASPPCQRYSAGTRAGGREKWPDLVGPTRDLLDETGLPYIIENVNGAPLHHPVTLCGRQFGLTATDTDGTLLQLDRHRGFETNWELPPMPSCRPHDRAVQVAGVYGGARRDKAEAREIRHGGYVPVFEVQQKLLGIDWMREREMYESLPPAYTEYVGRHLLNHIAAA